MRHETLARGTVTLLGAKDTAELAAVEELARACFDEAAFSTAEELARPWSRVWCVHIEEEEAPAGFLLGWHVADELHILNIATRPSLRRRGAARALMDEALAYAARHHVRVVLLEVRRSNRPAIKLYRSLRFTALGVRPAYYADNDEDAVVMVLGLDPASGAALPGKDEVRVED